MPLSVSIEDKSKKDILDLGADFYLILPLKKSVSRVRFNDERGQHGHQNHRYEAGDQVVP